MHAGYTVVISVTFFPVFNQEPISCEWEHNRNEIKRSTLYHVATIKTNEVIVLNVFGIKLNYDDKNVLENIKINIKR